MSSSTKPEAGGSQQHVPQSQFGTLGSPQAGIRDENLEVDLKSLKGKEKIEELKQEAKLSRELVQLEKFMEERKKKRDRRDDDGDGGGPPARGSRGADISQNEMF